MTVVDEKLLPELRSKPPARVEIQLVAHAQLCKPHAEILFVVDHAARIAASRQNHEAVVAAHPRAVRDPSLRTARPRGDRLREKPPSIQESNYSNFCKNPVLNMP